MKPLEYINLENEYAVVKFWAEKYCDAITFCYPDHIEDTLRRAEMATPAEREEILASIKENATDTVMYPLCREVLIKNGVLTEEEIEKCDERSAMHGFPVSTEEEVLDSRFAIACNMSNNKTRISFMNENDRLYGMYKINGGEHLANKIRMNEEKMFRNADIVVDFSQCQDDTPAQ